MLTNDPWDDYRRRRLRLLLVIVFGLPILALAFFISSYLQSSLPVVVCIFCFASLLVWFSVVLSRFPCPRCGKPFIYSNAVRNGFAKKCVNCQLPKWSKPKE